MSDQPPYSANDIQVLSDAVGFVRKHPEMFFRNGFPRAEDLVEHILSDMLCALPRRRRLSVWGFGGCELNEGVANHFRVSLDVLHRIVPMPRRGQNCDRADILIAASAKAVVTAGPEGIT